MSQLPQSRGTRGISQTDRDSIKLYYEKTVKEAEVRRWIFFCESDKKLIEIHHSHGAWPLSYSIWDKMDLKKKDCVRLKHQGKSSEFSLVQNVHRDFLEAAMAKAEARLGEKLAQSSTVRDITMNQTDENVGTREDMESSLLELDRVLDELEGNKENSFRSPSEQPGATSTAKKLFKRSHEFLDEESPTCSKKPRVVLGKTQQGSTNGGPQLTDNRDALNAMVEVFKSSMETLLENHKVAMESILKHFKAEKREFLSVIKAHLETNGSPSGVPGGARNDDSEPPILYNGQNLLKIYAAESPSLFGRELARALFGEGANCELDKLLVGPASKRKGARKPCDEHRLKLFKDCVARKYPGAVEISYEQARKSANQYGLEMKQLNESGENSIGNSKEGPVELDSED